MGREKRLYTHFLNKFIYLYKRAVVFLISYQTQSTRLWCAASIYFSQNIFSSFTFIYSSLRFISFQMWFNHIEIRRSAPFEWMFGVSRKSLGPLASMLVVIIFRQMFLTIKLRKITWKPRWKQSNHIHSF